MAQEGEGPNDREVVERVLAGDVECFAVLVRRYRQPLLHLAANRLGNLNVAEDAVQDAFLSAFKSLHTYRSEFSFRTWLWTILLNQCKRHAAQLAKQPAPQSTCANSSQHVVGVAADSSPERCAIDTERNQLLRAELVALPEHQADAIRLRFFGQLKYREIADAMPCSLSAAKKWVREGLQTISQSLRERNLVDALHPGDEP